MASKPLSVGARKLAELLSRKALSAKLDVTRQAISLWLAGDALPSPERMKEIEDIYGIPMREWMEAAPVDPEPVASPEGKVA